MVGSDQKHKRSLVRLKGLNISLNISFCFEVQSDAVLSSTLIVLIPFSGCLGKRHICVRDGTLARLKRDVLTLRVRTSRPGNPVGTLVCDPVSSVALFFRTSLHFLPSGNYIYHLL